MLVGDSDRVAAVRPQGLGCVLGRPGGIRAGLGGSKGGLLAWEQGLCCLGAAET